VPCVDFRIRSQQTSRSRDILRVGLLFRRVLPRWLLRRYLLRQLPRLLHSLQQWLQRQLSVIISPPIFSVVGCNLPRRR
jgi:hypothetical protein